MKVEVLPNGKHVISDGDDVIELTQVSYEDIFYAIPIDNGSLFMLLNDTVLETAQARATLKRIVDRKGGNDPAMSELQALVKDVQPGGSAPPPPPPPPEPEPEEEEEEKTIVLPNIKLTPPAPVKAAPAPTPKTPLPARPMHPTPAKGVVPLAPTPAKGVTPVTPGHPTPARPAPPLPSALPPMAPLKKTEHPKPALPPMAPLKKTEQPKPAAPVQAEPAKTPAGGVPSLTVKSFDAGGKPAVKVTKLGADLFAIVWGDMAVSLSRAKYERLHGMCPAPTSTLFHTLMSEVLTGAEKATFRKIVAQAGHSKPILDAVNEQVQKLHPGSAVKKG
ncbi:MAG: hypothetical protein AAB434_01685 [Planctomycetota bacterium]